MERSEHTKKGRHLRREERMVIETMSRGGYPPRDIAAVLGRHPRTIEREQARGRVRHVDTHLCPHYVYSSDRGQAQHALNATAKGPALKLGAHRDWAAFFQQQIIGERASPAVAAHRMKSANLGGIVCTKTIYTYIDLGWIAGVSNESLPEKRKRRKQGYKTVRRQAKKAPPPGHSITDRPAHVAEREEFGHWEIDLIVSRKGASKVAWLTLVERKTRKVLIRKLADKTQAAVHKALAALERAMGAEAFRVIFKSITADNGSEFLDVLTLERSCWSAQHRTRWYYAHPFSAWERGSNENANRMIRRFVPKGTNLARISDTERQRIEDWLNHYPRKILAFHTAAAMYAEALAA